MSIFGLYCATLPYRFFRGEMLRLGPHIYKVVFSINEWHLLRRV